MGTSPFAIASGTITINPYSQTRLAITQITGLFKTSGLLRVYVGPMDAAGLYIVNWDNTNKSIYAYLVSTPAQAAEGLTTLGIINWTAIGQMG
jgi:hypothetical protein